MNRNEFNGIYQNMYGKKLPGRYDQGIREESAIQNYTLGSRRFEDGWVFHYMRASVAIPVASGKFRLAGSRTPYLAANELTLTAVAAAGQNIVSIPDAASVVNYYRGGIMECWPAAAGGVFELHRIASSTVSDGTNVQLTLESPLTYALAIGELVVPMPNMYYAVGPMGVTYPQREQAVGVPLIAVTAEYYFWGITWGEVMLSCQASGWPEDAAACMDVFAWQDGTVAHLAAWAAGTYDGAGTSPQRVGHGLYGGDYGTGQIMLQLNP